MLLLCFWFLTLTLKHLLFYVVLRCQYLAPIVVFFQDMHYSMGTALQRRICELAANILAVLLEYSQYLIQSVQFCSFAVLQLCSCTPRR